MEINAQKANVDYASPVNANERTSGTTGKTGDVAKGIQAGATGLPDAQGKALLTAISNSDLSPKPSIKSLSDPEVEAQLDEIERLLNSSNSSDAARLLGRLLGEIGALQRKEALNDRLLARDAAQSELKAGAKQLDSAATATMVGAGASLALGLVSAGVSIAFAGKAMSAMNSGTASQGTVAVTQPGNAGAAAQGTNAAVGQGANAAANSNATTIAQTINMKGGAIAGLASSGGQFAGAMGQSTAQTYQADQAREQANAEVTKSESELEATEQQALQEFVNQIIQFIKELRDAEVEQLAVVTRG